jgi:AraC-like DNA-binding protein
VTRLSFLGFINTERTRMPVRKRLRSRGVPTALQGREVLCTHDQVEATEAVSAMLGLATLSTDRTAREEFQTTLNAIRFLDVTMAYLDFRAPTRLAVERAADAFTVHMTTHDSAEVVVAGTRHEVSAFSALVSCPGSGYVMNLGQDCPQLIVRIERRAVERQLSRMLGRSLDRPIVFDPVANLTTDEAVRWHGAIQLLSSEIISASSLIQQGLGAASIEELIVSTLLYIQPSNYFDRLRHARRTSGRVAVRHSIAYIDEHLAERISMADLAEHASVSIRSIQTGFREDLGTTPVAYIRDRRLDKAREALMGAMPSDGITVASIAERWGFANAGSFSVRYRERFGESPSQTLRR